MKTISSAVEMYIKNKPYLQTALYKGILNYTALAKEIVFDLEGVLKKKVNVGAVVMALKRLSEYSEFRINYKIINVLKNLGEITVRSNLQVYTFPISNKVLKKQVELLKEVNMQKDMFYTSSRGVNEINIILANLIAYKVESIFETEKSIHKMENVASITVKLPEENIFISGVYYYIFQQLAWEDIIINEVISTSNEFTIIVSENQVDNAFKVIKSLKNKA